ncbi:hypothetical protein RYX56_21435, partial [Alkalihalophilus lindianensis]
QNAIRSATVTTVNMDGRDVFIKNRAEEEFPEILMALGLEDIPTYGQKDKRTNAYLQRKK